MSALLAYLLMLGVLFAVPLARVLRASLSERSSATEEFDREEDDATDAERVRVLEGLGL